MKLVEIPDWNPDVNVKLVVKYAVVSTNCYSALGRDAHLTVDYLPYCGLRLWVTSGTPRKFKNPTPPPSPKRE